MIIIIIIIHCNVCRVLVLPVAKVTPTTTQHTLTLRHTLRITPILLQVDNINYSGVRRVTAGGRGSNLDTLQHLLFLHLRTVPISSYLAKHEVGEKVRIEPGA